ncbi:OLC1v1037089C1 [Oldenlandia corymbosa var. corymbosa]|uniref:OLC1v1037089C1 n=1 Tax=Oldenlandia corymbosa var. corymbosa TaxID=529605 RepID=A0AAV1CZI8_OLDCO|nr:OLC1v1037089C1 [Oldenlandia corymbosa var. corymbosa]
MEVFYFLGSIIFTSTTSFILSIVLFLRRLLLPSGAKHTSEYVSLYEGTVSHERRHPVRHYFWYPVRYALFDLDHATNVPPNHFSADEARQICETNGPVLLLTIPASVGYEQNPVSLFYCYDVEGSSTKLKRCIVEVTNTPWGERVSFSFDPHSVDTVAKTLQVSPFMDMFGNWSMRTTAPEDNITVTVGAKHPELGNYMTAILKLRKVSDKVATDPYLFCWLMPHKVVIWIYWQALQLWWKGLHFFEHPKYKNPNYREQCVFRDNKIQGNQSVGKQAETETINIGTSHVAVKTHSHSFIWREAKWPWK